MIVVDHIDVRVDDGAAFRAAFAPLRAQLLASRGCRNVDVTSADATYRIRIEWRSEADRAAFDASAVDRALAGFEPIARATGGPVELADAGARLDAAVLRSAFAHFPSGIAAITAIGRTGPIGIVVSSFTSVSLEPPLVGFFVARDSTSHPLIADARRVCVNIVSASQEELSRKLASKKGDRFAGVAWRPSPGGAPILEGVVGWMECEIVETRRAGDHDVVLLAVVAHDADPDGEPLVFHRSAYKRLGR